MMWQVACGILLAAGEIALIIWAFGRMAEGEGFGAFLMLVAIAIAVIYFMNAT